MEEQTEGTGGGDRASDLLAGDGLADDLLEVGAGFLVITEREFGLDDDGGREKEEEKEEK